jgi:hypothetical protein
VIVFLGMAWWSQRVYPVQYQWRRVASAAAAAVALATLGKLVDVGFVLAVGIAAVYPLVLLPLGFYLPAERRRMRAIIAR